MTEPYRFGQFTLDPVARRLCVAGVPVPLGPTDFRLLLALVEHAGAIVAKDDLMLLVGGRAARDNVLHVHVTALRKTLGRDCIVNQQGRGYRFVAPMRRIEPGAPRTDAEHRAGNLPSYWTDNATGGHSRLMGRSEQLLVVADLLAHRRLVTLTGPGGVGKTRLGLQAGAEAASHFRDGVWLVELAPLNDPESVPGAIASTLGVKIGANATSLDTLSRYLLPKSLLILLDNCEHVLAACARTAETLLAAAPGLKIIATSREALSCCGEQVLLVPTLAVPDEGEISPDVMRGMAAIDLFIERAMHGDANFRVDDKELAIVGRICRRLDGLPLAIEMGAGWAGILGLEMLDENLDKAWLRARSMAPPRHSTMLATLDWSYDLLSAAERAVLRRLAAFAGSFTMEAAEAVASDDAIPKEAVIVHVASLIRKSMVAVLPGFPSQHYRLLETTRAFMLEKLAASGDGTATRRRHACHVLSVLERAGCELETTSDAVWVARYGPLLDDLRAALDWAMGEDSEDAVALAGASWPLWPQLSLRTEGKQRLGAVRLHPQTPPALEARLRRGLGEMLLHTAEVKAGLGESERAVILYRTLGDIPHLGSALTRLAFTLLMLDRIEKAEHAILEALRLLEPVGWLRTLATAYSTQLCIEATLGRFDDALVAGGKAARLCEIVGAERAGLAVASNLVQLALERGEFDGAIVAGRCLAERVRDAGYYDLCGFVLGILAAALTARGDLDEALTAAREAAPLLCNDGALFWLFDHLGLRAALCGRMKDAALIAGYANAVHQKFCRPREPKERRAMERMTLLLRDVLPNEEIAQLGRLGAELSEGQAMKIALSA